MPNVLSTLIIGDNQTQDYYAAPCPAGGWICYNPTHTAISLYLYKDAPGSKPDRVYGIDPESWMSQPMDQLGGIGWRLSTPGGGHSEITILLVDTVEPASGNLGLPIGYTPLGKLGNEGNTLDIPEGINLTLDLTGRIHGSSFKVVKTGTGARTLLKAHDVLGSAITITEGDSLEVTQNATNTTISSSNNNNGVGCFTDGDNGSAHSYYNFIASAPGNLQVYFCSAFAGSNIITYHLNGGAAQTTPMYNANNGQGAVLTASFGNDFAAGGNPSSNYETNPVILPLTAGNNTLSVHWNVGSPDTTDSTFCVESWNGSTSSSLILAQKSPGNPSKITLGSISGGGVALYGDTITVSNMSNSIIQNIQGSNAAGSTINVAAGMLDSTVKYSSPLSLSTAQMDNATVTVPTGLTRGSIRCSELLADTVNLTTAQPNVIGTNIVPRSPSYANTGFAITANGNSGAISTYGRRIANVNIDITSVAGSSSPSIEFTLYREGPNGTQYEIAKSGALTAAGTTAISAGPGTANNLGIGQTILLAWTVSGSSPSFKGNINVDLEE